MRIQNTKRLGTSWTNAEIEAVWRKGVVVPGYNPAVYRQDACNAWIERTQHGRETKYGLEIDHIMPVSQGGSDDLSNLQPLNWANNRHKADHWPYWSCAVQAQ